MKKQKLPSEILREMLQGIEISDSIRVKSFDMKKFIRDARQVKATFKNEDLQVYRGC